MAGTERAPSVSRGLRSTRRFSLRERAVVSTCAPATRPQRSPRPQRTMCSFPGESSSTRRRGEQPRCPCGQVCGGGRGRCCAVSSCRAAVRGARAARGAGVAAGRRSARSAGGWRAAPSSIRRDRRGAARPCPRLGWPVLWCRIAPGAGTSPIGAHCLSAPLVGGRASRVGDARAHRLEPCSRACAVTRSLVRAWQLRRWVPLTRPAGAPRASGPWQSNLISS
jgi:hypothetical protein